MTSIDEAPLFRLAIDRDQCQGHGRCYSLAPTLVEPDDDGFPILKCVRLSAQIDVTNAEAIVASCPEQAISLDRAD
jgi:ferredoxin